jgi:hypothetical protein
MWTPPQWSIAFPIVATVMLGLGVLLASAGAVENAWTAAIAGGLVAGLFLAIAWTLGRLLTPIAALCAAAAMFALIGAYLAAPSSLLGAIGIALLASITWIVFYHGVYSRAIMRPRPAPDEFFGPADGARKALIIHHPGRSGFHARLQRAFAAALGEKGWRVALTTAHAGNHADPRAYDLLALGAPAYNFRVAEPLLDQLERIGPLYKMDVMLMVSGGGMTEPALRDLYRRIERAGGGVIAALEVWTTRSNRERHGTDDPVEIVRRAALTIAGVHGAERPRPRLMEDI